MTIFESSNQSPELGPMPSPPSMKSPELVMESSSSAMETQQEKVYVAVGKDVQEGLGTLGWAIRTWSSQPVSFVILHVSSNSMDFVCTPIGKLPASSVSNDKLKVFRALEQEKVDKYLSKYTAFCTKLKAEVMKVEGSEEAIDKTIVELISSLQITKLVMGFSYTKTLSWKTKVGITSPFYVHKHKPEFCELFIVCGGKLVAIKEESNEGGVEDEQGRTPDLRRKSKERGSFKGWLGKMLSDSTHQGSSPPMDLPSPTGASKVHEVDHGEDIGNYIESLLAASAEESNGEEDDAAASSSIDNSNLETTDSSMTITTRNETKVKLEEAHRMAEEKKSEAKADTQRRTKAERATSFLNQRNEVTEAQLREEAAKQALLNEELDAVRAQLREVSGDIAGGESRLKSALGREGELTTKLRGVLSETARVEARLVEAERERVEMLREMEEVRRKRDVLRRQIEYLRAREVAAVVPNGSGHDHREFSVEELREATDGFSERMVVGAGAGGKVYKGTLNHVTVAIECNNELCMRSPEGFKAQVDVLRQIRHPHVVAMIGACMEHKCIIFEYMHHGNLCDALKNKTPHLPWHIRIRIAIDVASALGFLHSGSAAHGRLTASRVLLDHHLRAKISGLRSPTHVNPNPDILALGTLVLQLLMGKEEVEWEVVAKTIREGDIKGILDKTAGDWPLDLATELARFGIQCTEVMVGEVERNMLAMPIISELEGLSVKVQERREVGSEGLEVQDDQQLEVPRVFVCPINQDMMRQPHVAADGFSYELEAIKEWFDSGHETSPMTNLKLKNKLLTPNYTLYYLINAWNQKNELK